MAVVPTTDGPIQGLAAGGTSTQQINAPAEAFGANVIGAGLQDLGKAAGMTSDELAQHALALQDMNNKASADKAYSAAVPAMSQEYANFRANVHGTDALQQLPALQSKMEEIRSAQEENLNPVAKAYYQQESRRVLAGMTMDLQSYASQQNHEGLLAASKAKSMAGWAAFAASPTPENLAEAEHVAMTEGRSQAIMNLGSSADPAVVDSIVKTQISASFVEALKGIAGGQGAAAAYEIAKAHPDLLYGEDQQNINVLKKAATSEYAAVDVGTAMKAIGSGAVQSPGPNANPRAWTPQARQELSSIRANPEAAFSQIIGERVTITSGERTPAHNAAVGGSRTSEHLVSNFAAGYGAWDVSAPGMSNTQIIQKLTAAGVPADQIIDEGSHVHVGFGPQIRGQVFSMHGGKTQGPPQNSAEVGNQLLQAQQMATHFAEQHFPGDPADPEVAANRENYIEQYTRSLDSRVGQTQRGMRDQEIESAYKMVQYIDQNNIQDPTTAMTIPGYQNLPPSLQHMVRGEASYLGNQPSAEREQNYHDALGKIEAAKIGQGDPTDLTRTDFGDMTRSDRMDIMRRQIAARNAGAKQAQENTVIKYALSSPAFQGLHLSRTDPHRDQIIGFVQAGIEQFQHDNGRMPKNGQEINDIVNQAAVRKQAWVKVLPFTNIPAPSWLGGGKGVDAEQREVPDSAMPQVDAVLDKLGIAKNDYNRAYYYESLRRAGRVVQ